MFDRDDLFDRLYAVRNNAAALIDASNAFEIAYARLEVQVARRGTWAAKSKGGAL